VKKLIFGTTNAGKLTEASQILNFDVEGVNLEIDEVQTLDKKEVAVKKAKAYYSQIKKPLFIEDVSLEIDYLKGLPGTYVDAFVKTLGPKGIADMIKGNNRLAKAITTLVYIWGKDKYKIFQGETIGSIAKKPKGEGFGWDPIFIPKGSMKTFGEMNIEEKNKYSMRKKALFKMHKYLSGKNF